MSHTLRVTEPKDSADHGSTSAVMGRAAQQGPWRSSIRIVALGVAAAMFAGIGLVAPAGSAVASAAGGRRHGPISGCNVHGARRYEASAKLPPSRLRGYARTYCDDFLGSEIGHGWFLFSGQPGGDPGALFDPSHVTQSKGILSINTYKDSSNGGNWATGGVCQCAYPQTYGAYFVRSRVTNGGDDNDELLWPYKNEWPPEVDFNETSPTTSQTGSYVHYDADNNQIGHQLNINLTQWHTWGVIWRPDSLTFTVDGHVWSKVTDPSAIPNVAMTLDLQEQTYCYNGAACPTEPVSLLVDWVTEFAPAR